MKARDKGIEIREGVTVKNVVSRNDFVIVETDAETFAAQIVVGADGSNGNHAAMYSSKQFHPHRGVLEVLAPSQPPPNSLNLGEAPEGRWGQAYFDFFPVPSGIAGYTWDFPTQINGELMRCWGIYDTNVLSYKERPALKEPLANEMLRHGFDLNQYELKGHPIRWFSPFNQFSAPRVILVGDAAGADGIFGEGISVALGYGLIAAKVIRDAFAQNDFSFRDYRRRILFSPLGQALTIRTGITHILYHLHWAWFQKFFWRVLNRLW